MSLILESIDHKKFRVDHNLIKISGLCKTLLESCPKDGPAIQLNCFADSLKWILVLIKYGRSALPSLSSADTYRLLMDGHYLMLPGKIFDQINVYQPIEEIICVSHSRFDLCHLNEFKMTDSPARYSNFRVIMKLSNELMINESLMWSHMQIKFTYQNESIYFDNVSPSTHLQNKNNIFIISIDKNIYLYDGNISVEVLFGELFCGTEVNATLSVEREKIITYDMILN